MARVLAHKYVLAIGAAVTLAGCHTIARVDETTNGVTSLKERSGQNRLGDLTVGVSADGSFRAQHRTWCPHDMMVQRSHFVIERKRPNVATFIVGLIAFAGGGISAIVGGAEDGPASSPFTWLGLAGMGAGLPLAIGPFLGNSSQRRKVGEETVRQGSKWVRCGNTPAPAVRGTLQWGTTRVPSPIAKDGRFAVSAFDLVDAFELSRTPALSLQATVTTKTGPDHTTHKAQVFIGTSKLTRARAGFFRRININGSVEPLRKVPRLETKALIITKSRVAGHPAVIVEFTVENAGPGAAWGVRGSLTANLPEIDARMIYIGHIPARGTGRGRIVIPVDSAAINLMDAGIAVFLHDAHKTTGSTPYRFRGPVLNATPEE